MITVTVTDGGLDNDLGTPGDMHRVAHVHRRGDRRQRRADAGRDRRSGGDKEDAGAADGQPDAASRGGGETQALTVTATSNNTR